MESNAIRHDLDLLESSDLINECEFRLTDKNEIIHTCGEQCTNLYIVSRGNFVLSDTSGSEYVVSSLDRGDVFGHMPFIPTSQPTSSKKVISMTAGELLVLTPEAFISLQEKNCELALSINMTLARKLHDELIRTESVLRLLLDNTENREKYEIRRLVAEMKATIHSNDDDSGHDENRDNYAW